MELEDHPQLLAPHPRQSIFVQPDQARPIQSNGPAIGYLQRPDDIEQGALARPRRPDNRGHLARPEAQVHPAQDGLLHPDETLDDSRKLQQTHASTVPDLPIREWWHGSVREARP